MQIEFRECDWFNLWIWFEFAQPPLEADQKYLEHLLESWYTIGMLGGYNAAALMAQEAGVDVSYLEYEPPRDELPALMHNMGSVEYQDNWSRCWFDLGTTDAMALDILLTSLETLSLEYLDLKRVIVGGQNDDWPVPELIETDEDHNGYHADHQLEEGLG
ncbi:MAG: DUF3531 family protein [Synechococcaceae cyanobacterium SM2_3_1]|nr:DUF3531 family protein [Synechococcaceae cyanobacterium SM2_3_1]